MRAYLMTTGVLFSLLVVAHVWRLAAEGPHVAKDPFFLVSTILAAGMSVWAWLLVRRLGRA